MGDATECTPTTKPRNEKLEDIMACLKFLERKVKEPGEVSRRLAINIVAVVRRLCTAALMQEHVVLLDLLEARVREQAEETRRNVIDLINRLRRVCVVALGQDLVGAT